MLKVLPQRLQDIIVILKEIKLMHLENIPMLKEKILNLKESVVILKEKQRLLKGR